MNRLAISAHVSGKLSYPAFVVAVAWLGFTASSFGGEKIQITTGSEKIELPGKSLNDDLFSKPLDFLKRGGGDGGGSLIPSLPAPNQPATLNKELLEKSNWLKNSTEPFDQDLALKQIFGVREYKFQTLEKKSKGSMGDPWEGRSSSRTQRPPGSMLDRPLSRSAERDRKDLSTDPFTRSAERDPFNLSKSSSDEDSVGGNAMNSELNLNNLLHPTQLGDPLSRVPTGFARMPTSSSSLGQLFNPTTFGQNGRTREQDLRAQEFEKLLKGQPAISKPLNDPINSVADSTRQEINPIRGKRPEDYSGSAISGIGSELPGFGRPSRSGFLDSLNTKVLGASSLTPTIVAPSPAPIKEFMPPVLDFPRRKF